MGWGRRAWNVFRSDALSRELDRELEFHVAERAEALREAGMSEGDALREARRRLGHEVLQKEHTRERDVLVWLDTVVADVRYALRALLASPGFSLVAVLSLALGIGANTAIFGLIDALVLKPLPVERPEELLRVEVGQRGTPRGTRSGGFAWPNPLWEALRDRQQVFAGLAAHSSEQFNLSESGEVREVAGSYVSGDFFPMLGLVPEAGRLLARGDDYRGCPPVAVLSASFWRREYGGSADVIGRSIRLSGKPVEVVGVVGGAFRGVRVGQSTDVYVPLCAEAVIAAPRSALDERSHWFLQVMGRPQPGRTLTDVAAHLAAVAPGAFAATLPEQYPPEHREEYLKGTFTVAPGAGGLSWLRNQYRTALLVLMGLVGVVLLIACANVANLLLARAATRRHEIAVRLAIGAGRLRIMRQLLTESVVLAVVSSALGVLLAMWGSRLLIAQLATERTPLTLDVPLDLRVLGFTLMVATAAALLFGLAPAWRGGREDPQSALRANSTRLVTGSSRFHAGKALVMAQLALCLALMVSAGLLLGTFRTLSATAPGFRSENVLLVAAALPEQRDSLAQQQAAYGPLLERLRSLPGVVSASGSQLTPIGGMRWNELIFVDNHTAASEQERLSYLNEVTDGYFRTLGTRVLAGREFGPHDDRGSPRVAVVNEAFARHFFGTLNVLGRELRISATDAPPVTIIGVVENTKVQSLREEPQRVAYLPWAQASERAYLFSFAVRTRGDERALRTAVLQAAHDVDPSLSLRFTPFAQQLSESLTRERLLATLSAFFGGLALLLAMIGLYGIMAYGVALRRNEIGVRMALGSARSGVLRLVLADAAAVLAGGLVLGMLLALATSRLVTTFLYGVTPGDPRTLLLSAAVLAGVGLAASALPAWRASRIEPMAA
ncbi:MAG TPA: ABC transporter permease, partial [Longimicrobiales bacterium]|nr:ABC transporter permease [Longimicrobiales bacterium]